MERERNGTAANEAEKDGIRKAPLFLSILDEEAADALLARFEPDVARAIEAEARRVGSVAPEDVDAIVAEFLALSELAETSNEAGKIGKTDKAGKAVVGGAGKAGEPSGGGKIDGTSEREREKGRNAWRDERTDDVGDVVVGDFQALDAIEPERLARLLSGASRTTVAVALSRLSERRRTALVALLPTEKAQSAQRALETLVRTTDAARRLEDALFNGALDDE